MIALDGVSKRYRSPFGRTTTALSDVSLRASAGEVVGIAGPNGAGKSTLIGLLLGFLAPSDGRLTIEGLSPRRWIERHGVGYVPEAPVIPPRWTLEGALLRYATLADVPAAERPARRDAAMTRFGLEEHRRKRIRHLSKGTRQRTALAQALVRRERLYVLDEPASGLDPLWTIAFRETIAGLRAPDVLVLIASHDLDELERIADRVLILHRGRSRGEVHIGARGRDGSWLRLVMHAGAALVPEIIVGARQTAPDAFEVPAGDPEALNAALAALIARGGRIAALEPLHPTLEQSFRDLVREAPPRE